MSEFFPMLTRTKTRAFKACLMAGRTLGIDELKTSAMLSHRPGGVPFTIVENAERIAIEQESQLVYFPSPMPRSLLVNLTCSYREWLRRKYCLPGFVSVETGDVVLDCGAFAGGFSLHCLDRASHVHLFEPAPANFACIAATFKDREDVTLNQLGLFDRNGELTFNISPSAVEHSLLTPDDGQISQTITVKVQTVEDYCRSKGIQRIDFAKVEAEGVELEVVEGFGSVPVEKGAVDVSPERDGRSPFPEIAELLRKRGYEIRRRKGVLFARLS